MGDPLASEDRGGPQGLEVGMSRDQAQVGGEKLF